MSYEFSLPSRIIFGPGRLDDLADIASCWGYKPLLVTGRGSMRKLGVTSRIVNDLRKKRLKVTTFERVEPNPRTTTIDAAAQVFRERKLDLIIALGGGSVMDAAKGIAIASSGSKPVWYYIEESADPEEETPPLIVIPTVAGSGSESNCGAVITNWMVHEKRVLSHESLYPVVSIVDPELTLSLPVKPTLQGGVDIFCHLLEPYLTDTNGSSLTDGIREATMKMVVSQLPFARADLKNLKIRIDLSWASTVACSAFASIGGGGGGMSLHGIEHAISAYCDAAHGDGLAALLPAWLEYTQQGGEERFNTLGRSLFLGKDAVLSINEWLCRIGMRLHLRDLGIERGILPKIAASVEQTASWVRDHPRGMQFQDILDIYEASY